MTVATIIEAVTATVRAMTVATMVRDVGARDVYSQCLLGAYVDSHLMKQQDRHCHAGTPREVPPIHPPASQASCKRSRQGDTAGQLTNNGPLFKFIRPLAPLW